MLMIKKLFKKSDSGFTLVELMAVVLIIGILVAIAIPMYNNSADNARRKTCEANIRTINGAISQYQATTPGAITDIATLTGNVLKKAPDCPFGAVAFPYVLTGNEVTAHTH